MEFKRKNLEKWLRKQGFAKLPRGSSGHVVYNLDGIRFSFTAHDRTVSTGIVKQLLERLEAVGRQIDREQVRKEIAG